MDPNQLPPEYQAEAQALMQRRALAQALAQRALTPQQTEMVGNRAVRRSPLSFLAQALTGYLGNKQVGQYDEQVQGLQKRAGDEQQRELTSLYQAPEDQRQVALAQALASRNPAVRAAALATQNRFDTQATQAGNWQRKDREFALDEKRFAADSDYRNQNLSRLNRELDDAIKRGDQTNAARLEQIKQGWAKIAIDREALGVRERLGQARIDAPQNRPMPAAALRIQNEEVDAIQTAKALNADLGAIRGQVDRGELKLGLGENLASKAKNFTGLSDSNSRNFATFNATLEKLRNDSLRLNKGVQTEGDAVRAWNELLANINDTNLVKQRLSEIEKINDRAANLRKIQLDLLRSNYNLPDLQVPDLAPVKPAVGGSSPSVENLPPGVRRVQ